MPEVLEEDKIFLNLPIGSFLRIDDFQALIGSVKEGGGVAAKEYCVKTHKKVLAYNADFSEQLSIVWHVYEIESDDQVFLLFYVREIDTGEEILIDKGLFYYPLEEAMTREELFNADMCWMFDAPEDLSNFKFCELILGKTPNVPPINDDDEDVVVEYKMKDAGIMDGDMVVAERSVTPAPNDIVIAEIDNEWTMKYYRVEGKTIFLEPANEKFENIYPKEELKIAAVVKAVVRKY